MFLKSENQPSSSGVLSRLANIFFWVLLLYLNRRKPTQPAKPVNIVIQPPPIKRVTYTSMELRRDCLGRNSSQSHERYVLDDRCIERLGGQAGCVRNSRIVG
jgi:hypothetical protein